METDCRTEEGITVGLIDGIISIARVLAKRDLSPDVVKEALLDFQQDSEFRVLLNTSGASKDGGFIVPRGLQPEMMKILADVPVKIGVARDIPMRNILDDPRVAELCKANDRFVRRARAAEAELAELRQWRIDVQTELQKIVFSQLFGV